MKVDVVMPQMGESITEGTVAKWLKKPGEKVERDETILEITTEKIDSEIPAPRSGVLGEIVVQEGETVKVGAVLARIETEAEKAEAKRAKPEEKVEAQAAEREAEKKRKPKERVAVAEPEKEEEAEVKERRPAISPLARRLAEKEGLSSGELFKIEGTGPGGRITRADVAGYIESQKALPAEEAEEEEEKEAEEAEIVAEERPAGTRPAAYEKERVEITPMSNMRKRIAEHMVQSKRASAHTYTVAEVDLTLIVKFRESVKADFEKREGFKLTYTPFILHAAVLALKKWPLMNSSLDGDKIIKKKYINLGIAVALEEGLIVPVIRGADEKNLLGLARSAHDLGTRARSKKLKPEEVQEGTFTVTNPGGFGSIFGLPIINQPQVGILGVGAIKKRPVVIDDAIAIRSMMYLSLSYDHRIIDGAIAGQFLQEVVRNLEQYETNRALAR